MIGLIGRKIGMTSLFDEDGVCNPVTVVECYKNFVSQVKNLSTDNYEAVQVTAGTKKQSRVNKPMAGHFAKANIEPGDMIGEFRIDSSDLDKYELGMQLSVNGVFDGVHYVDVSSYSKGKGFAGVIKRHNFRMQDATHGNSRSHRAPGSIGQNQSPGKVFKGKKMAGQMGNKRCTVQSLRLLKIDAERNLLLIKGAIPGAPGARVEVRPAIKKTAGEQL